MPAHKEGFTLVELLVVISIIAILSVIGITIYTSTQTSARDARRRGDLHAIALAFEQYKAVNNSYPTGCDGKWNTSATWTVSGCGLTGYIVDMPKDPQSIDIGSCASTDNCHLYRICTDATGTVFTVGVNLENGPAMGASPVCSGFGGPNPFWITNQQ